jgi:periplasmic iron binding protein
MRFAAKSAVLAALAACLWAAPASAREFYVGGPVHEHDMEIVANYLVGIEMAPMMPGMVHGADVIHIEADVHATADNVYGYPDGAWVAYLTIRYTLEKKGAPSWKASGVLRPMTAKDGPHYAENVKMDGPGEYVLTYRFEPPEQNGFFRHTDRETGVPEWWAPFEETFTFHYPQAE